MKHSWHSVRLQHLPQNMLIVPIWPKNLLVQSTCTLSYLQSLFYVISKWNQHLKHWNLRDFLKWLVRFSCMYRVRLFPLTLFLDWTAFDISDNHPNAQACESASLQDPKIEGTALGIRSGCDREADTSSKQGR